MRYWLTLCGLFLVGCGGSDNGDTNGTPGDRGTCATTLDGSKDRITIDTTWKNGSAGCDYLVKSILEITSGTLTIEPGTVIQLAQDAGISVEDDGAIDAEGTASSHIQFEGQSDVVGLAMGIYFNQPDTKSTFNYVDFRNLGKLDPVFSSPRPAIAGEGTKGVSITNVTVQKSRIAGMILSDFAVTKFQHNAFNDNDGPGIAIDGGMFYVMDDTTDYIGSTTPNGDPWIDITAGPVDGTLTRDVTIKPLNAPYHVSIVMDITNGTTTIAPGVTFLFNDGGSLEVEDGAQLIATGTSANHITFKGESASTNWDYVEVFDAEAHFSYCDFTGASNGLLIESATGHSTVSVDNSTFHNCDVGVCVDTESSLSGSGDSISGGGVLQATEGDDC